MINQIQISRTWTWTFIFTFYCLLGGSSHSPIQGALMSPPHQNQNWSGWNNRSSYSVSNTRNALCFAAWMLAALCGRTMIFDSGIVAPYCSAASWVRSQVQVRFINRDRNSLCRKDMGQEYTSGKTVGKESHSLLGNWLFSESLVIIGFKWHFNFRLAGLSESEADVSAAMCTATKQKLLFISDVSPPGRCEGWCVAPQVNCSWGGVFLWYLMRSKLPDETCQFN